MSYPTCTMTLFVLTKSTSNGRWKPLRVKRKTLNFGYEKFKLLIYIWYGVGHFTENKNSGATLWLGGKTPYVLLDLLMLDRWKQMCWISCLFIQFLRVLHDYGSFKSCQLV